MIHDVVCGVLGIRLPRDESGPQWAKRMVEETKGLKPGEILAHLTKDYEENGPPPRMTPEEREAFLKTVAPQEEDR